MMWDGGWRMVDGRRIVSCVVFCVALLATSAIVHPPSAIVYAQSDAEHQQFLFAYKLLQRGELADAAEQFDQYIGKFPTGEKLGDAKYYRALLYRKAGDNTEAAAVLKDAAKPTLVPAYAVDLLAGQVLSDLKQYKDALASLEKIKVADLDAKAAVSVHYLKGMAYRGAENLEAAAASLSDAAKLDTPMKARALLDLAKVEALKKDTDAALSALDKCLEQKDKAVAPEAARFAGDLSYNAGSYEAAIGYYNAVVSRYQSSSHFSPAVIGLLWAQFADKRYDAVGKTFESAAASLPEADRFPAYYLAGSAAQELGDHKQAAELLGYDTASEQHKALYEKMLYKRAVSLFELKQFEQMNYTANRLEFFFPDSPLGVDLAFLRATADAEAGEVERGAARLTEFINQGTQSPYYQQALLRRAHLYETHEEIEAAAGDYKAYLKSVTKPTATSIQAGFRLMELRGALGQHDEVVTLATGVLELTDTALRTPGVEQEALYRLAVAQRFKGDLDAALAVHARLTRDHPINPYKAESVLEQGLIRMAQGDADRGVPLLLDAAGRDGLSKLSKLNALRVVSRYDEDKRNNDRAFELRSRMIELGGVESLSDSERLWLADQMIQTGSGTRQQIMPLLTAAGTGEQRDRAYLLAGRVERVYGDLDEALELLGEVRANSEAYSIEAWLEIALVYRDQGKADQALNELAALQDPDRGHRIASRALYEAGLIHKQLAKKLRPTAPDKAEVHVKSSREMLKKLWLLYPDREGEVLAKRAYLHLAALQHAAGEDEAEIKTLTELIDAAPQTPYATLAKAVLAQRAGKAERAEAYVRQMKGEAGADPELQPLARELLSKGD